MSYFNLVLVSCLISAMSNIPVSASSDFDEKMKQCRNLSDTIDVLSEEFYSIEDSSPEALSRAQELYKTMNNTNESLQALLLELCDTLDKRIQYVQAHTQDIQNIDGDLLMPEQQEAQEVANLSMDEIRKAYQEYKENNEAERQEMLEKLRELSRI